MLFQSPKEKNMTDREKNLLDEVYDAFAENAKVVDPGQWQGIHLDKKIRMWETLNTTIYMPMAETAHLLQKDTLADQPWTDLHFEERMTPDPVNPGETYKLWPWNTFNDESDDYIRHNKKFSHTYMERYWGKVAQPDVIADYLKKNKGTRQAYFPVWWDEEDAQHRADGNRIPCTLGYLFMIREDIMHITYYIRSQDLLRHFRNDIHLTVRLAQWVRDKIGSHIRMGQLTMHVGSLHLFQTDKYALEKREERKFDGLTISK